MKLGVQIINHGPEADRLLEACQRVKNGEIRQHLEGDWKIRWFADVQFYGLLIKGEHDFMPTVRCFSEADELVDYMLWKKL